MAGKASQTLLALACLALTLPAESGVVIQKPKVMTKSIESATAIEDYRKADAANTAQEKLAKNTIASAPGSRTSQYLKVMTTQGKAVAMAAAASEKAAAMMDDVKIEGDPPTMEPPQTPDDLESQAGQLADDMGSPALGCGCAAQLYGDAGTTEDTRVSLASVKHVPHHRKHAEQKANCNC